MTIGCPIFSDLVKLWTILSPNQTNSSIDITFFFGEYHIIYSQDQVGDCM